jgi:RNA polymerase sigma-70 factor (ECF subfamily)
MNHLRRPGFFPILDYKRPVAADTLTKIRDENGHCQNAWVEAFARLSSGTIKSGREMAGLVNVASDTKADFAELLRRHQSQLFAYIYSLVRNFDDADDLFQQTSVVLWDKFDQFDRSRRFVAWACGVARYEVLNYLRARSRHRLYFSDELNLALIEAQDELEAEPLLEQRDALATCMKKLRMRDQELLEACYGHCQCISEVANSWGRSTHSIHNSLRRIRRALFECVRRTLAQEEFA